MIYLYKSIWYTHIYMICIYVVDILCIYLWFVYIWYVHNIYVHVHDTVARFMYLNTYMTYVYFQCKVCIYACRFYTYFYMRVHMIYIYCFPNLIHVACACYLCMYSLMHGICICVWCLYLHEYFLIWYIHLHRLSVLGGGSKHHGETQMLSDYPQIFFKFVITTIPTTRLCAVETWHHDAPWLSSWEFTTVK